MIFILVPPLSHCISSLVPDLKHFCVTVWLIALLCDSSLYNSSIKQFCGKHSLMLTCVDQMVNCGIDCLGTSVDIFWIIIVLINWSIIVMNDWTVAINTCICLWILFYFWFACSNWSMSHLIKLSFSALCCSLFTALTINCLLGSVWCHYTFCQGLDDFCY